MRLSWVIKNKPFSIDICDVEGEKDSFWSCWDFEKIKEKKLGLNEKIVVVGSVDRKTFTLKIIAIRIFIEKN
jgi:hypothetical protein